MSQSDFGKKFSASCCVMSSHELETYDVYLNIHMKEIIEQLGGIRKVIQKCLDDSDGSNTTQNINAENFERLKQILNHKSEEASTSKTNLNLNSTKSEKNHQLTSKVNVPLAPSIDSMDTMDDDNTNTTQYNNKNNKNRSGSKIGSSSSISYNNSTTNNRIENNAIMNCSDSTIEWYFHRMTIDIDFTDNLYFRYFPNSIAQFLVYKLIFNKWYMVVMFILYILITAVDKLYLNIGRTSMPGGVLLSIWTISYILSANIQIVKLILETFDFWFKIYNLIIYAISFCILYENTYPLWYRIGTVISMTLLITTFSIVDGIMFHHSVKHLKQILIVCVCIVWTYVITYVYFAVDSVYITIFPQFDQTDIDVKALYMSSYFNITLFTFKTVASPLFRYLRRKCCNGGIGAYNANKLKHMERHHCGLIYKKPNLQWKNPTLKQYKDSVRRLTIPTDGYSN